MESDEELEWRPGVPDPAQREKLTLRPGLQLWLENLSLPRTNPISIQAERTAYPIAWAAEAPGPQTLAICTHAVSSFSAKTEGMWAASPKPTLPKAAEVLIRVEPSFSSPSSWADVQTQSLLPGVGSVEAEPVCLRRRAVVVPLGLGWQETGKD